MWNPVARNIDYSEDFFKIREDILNGTENVMNFGLGYIWEQACTTLGNIPRKLLERALDEKNYPVSYYDDPRDDVQGTFSGLGMLVGGIQDIAMTGLAISHLRGNDSSLASIAATTFGIKIAGITAALGINAYQKYLAKSIKQQSP